MLDTPCSEVVWRVLATHSIRQFPPSLHLPCVTVCHHISIGLYQPLWAIADCVSFTFHLRIIFTGHFYVSKMRTLHAPVTNGPLNVIKTPLQTKILRAGPLTLSSKIRMCVKLDLPAVRGDHTHGIFKDKVLAAILWPHKLEETEKNQVTVGFIVCTVTWV